jgi:hypothetical protein
MGGLDCSAEIEMTVYLAWLAMLARAAGDARVTIRVRAADEAVAFDLTGDTAELDPVRERAEALGGRLAISPGRASGWLPRSP